MSDEPIEVSLARLEGKVEQVATLLEQRQRQQEKEIHDATSKASRLHSRIDEEVSRLRKERREEVSAIRREILQDLVALRAGVDDLNRWRERLEGKAVGLAVGIGIGSGVASGGLVAWLVRMIGA